MKNSSLARFATASSIVIAFSVAALPQSAPQATNKRAPIKKQKPAPTTHKVWTEDDISTVRRPADRYIDASDRQSQAANSAASVQDASAKQPVEAPAKPAKKAPLSQAKSANDAEAKIGWEERDIRGQEEYIASLQQRLASATPEERAHLEQLIEQHKQIIVDTRKEMQGLEEQKKNFEKKPEAPAATPAPAPSAAEEAQPPSQ